MINVWQPGHTYSYGDVVTHDGKVWQKDANANDQTMPDAVAGGWDELLNTNLAEFNAIAASFSSYEQRVKDHKAKVEADRLSALHKLEALGLTEDEVKALVGT